MDIRSPAATHIAEAFDQGRMVSLNGTAIDADFGQVYSRTSAGRFARLDINIQQLSILSEDKTCFRMVSALKPSETLLAGAEQPPMTREVLLPPLSFWQRTGSTLPWALGLTASFGAGYLARGLLHHTAATTHADVPALSAEHAHSHSRYFSSEYDMPSDSYASDAHREASWPPVENVVPNAYETQVYDGEGTRWEEMGVGQKAAFCAVTAAGVTGGTIAFVGCTNVFVVQPVVQAVRERAAQRAYAQFEARQQAEAAAAGV